MADKKTYLLTKYEQYLINTHEYRMITEDQLCKGFITNTILPRLRHEEKKQPKADKKPIDLNTGKVTWDATKGELYYEKTESADDKGGQPQAQRPKK